MFVQRKEFTGVPMTIARLRALRRGEEMVYYRGNFPADIDRSKRGQDPTPRAYARLLEAVQREANELSKKGRVHLGSKLIHKPRRGEDPAQYITEYSAVGA